jgi:hypothetical protein
LLDEQILSLHWYLLRARPNRVFKAALALQDRGFQTALPHEWRARRRSRHCKSVTRFPLPHLGPYLITGFETRTPAWRSLFEDPLLEPLLSGVVSITSDGLPTLIRPKEIVRQHHRYGPELFRLPPKSIVDEIEDQRLQAGDAVRIGRWQQGWMRASAEFDAGGFADKVVTIDRIEGDMAKVVMAMFGSEREITVPLEHLAAA